MIVVDELARFMNVAWPGGDWYLAEHAEFLWEQTFTDGGPGEIYRPLHPGTPINLDDFDGRVCWQGAGRDPTRGAGHRLSELFWRWRQQLDSVAVVAFVPCEQLETVRAQLEAAGCLVTTAGEPILPSR